MPPSDNIFHGIATSVGSNPYVGSGISIFNCFPSVYVAIAPGGARRGVCDTVFYRPGQPQEELMSPINFLIIAAIIATVFVLTLGLSSMARGGTYDKEYAEKFMWERVGLQLLVVILLVAAVVLSNT